MKKIIILLLCLLSIMKVDAEEKLSCLPTSSDKPLILEETNNFNCSNMNGDTLTFKNNDTDLSKYFSYVKNEDNTVMINIKDNTLVFDSNLEFGIVVINDGKTTYSLYVKNNAYVKPTTTTTTNKNEITYTITLDNKGVKEEKTCSVSNEGDICYITLPNLEDDNFKGWGTASTCQDGKIGSTKVNENITYYACYENNENESKEIYLKSLKIMDSNNNEINFGTFSIKKKEYDFKVLNDIDTLVIEAESDEGIKIDYTGTENLVVGENEVIITLTDKNNNTSEYKLVVTRLEEGETISNINYLSALVVGNYNIPFDKDVFDYNLTIDRDIDKLEINAISLDEDNLVEIIGNNDLVNESVVSINVTNSDGETTTYKLNIIKESNSNIYLLLGLGIILVLIIILIILIIIKKKQKKKLEKNTSKPETINHDIEVLKF